MKYVVKSKNSYGIEYIEFETERYSKAYHYCKRRNAKIVEYLKRCLEDDKKPCDTCYYWFEKKGKNAKPLRMSCFDDENVSFDEFVQTSKEKGIIKSNEKTKEHFKDE